MSFFEHVPIGKARGARLIMAKGIAFLLLGLVHEAAIAWEWERIRSQAPRPLTIEYAFWFGVGGALFLFMGIVDILCSRALKKGPNALAWHVALTGSLLATVMSLIGWLTLGRGPPCLVLFLGLYGTAVLWTIRR